MKLKVLSLNVAQMVYDIFGVPLYSFTKFGPQRFNRLHEHLFDLDADIIALQEIYSLRHKRLLAGRLGKLYPHYYFTHYSYKLSLENGQMIFSKVPLTNTSFYRFKNKLWEENLLSAMGFLMADISFGGEAYSIMNVHFTAGGLRGPQSAKAEAIRARQIDELFKLIPAQKPTIVLGDFNCGPKTSKTNFSRLTENQKLVHFNDRLETTWDPENYLNKDSFHAHCPPQCIDHIFFSPEALNHITEAKHQVVFKQPTVKVSDKIPLISISDHNGVLADLTYEAERRSCEQLS